MQWLIVMVVAVEDCNDWLQWLIQWLTGMVDIMVDIMVDYSG